MSFQLSLSNVLNASQYVFGSRNGTKFGTRKKSHGMDKEVLGQWEIRVGPTSQYGHSRYANFISYGAADLKGKRNVFFFRLLFSSQVKIALR